MLSGDVGFLLAIACMVAVTPLSLVAALLIKRRLEAIAPKPEEAQSPSEE
jgi:hypothetical protein